MKKKKAENYNIEDIEDKDTYSEPESDENIGALSDDEMAMLKASIESAKIDRSKLPPHDTSDKAMFFRFLRSNILLTVASVIVAVAIVLSAIGGSVFLAIKLFNYHRDFTIVIGEDDPYKIDYDDAVINGVLYIDFKKIAAHTGLISSSGSPTGIQFTSPKDGSYLKFENESSRVWISGGMTEMLVSSFEENKNVIAVAYVNENECLVPISFLSKTISKKTMTFTYDQKSNTVNVNPKYLVYDKDTENKVIKDLLFITDNFEVTLPKKERPVYNYNYAIDVSAYLDSITAEYLMLANKQNSIEAYAPAVLKKLTCPTAPGRTFELDYDAAIALEAMMKEMEDAGITETYVTSAYRDYAYQKNLYTKYVNQHIAEGMTPEEAEAKASTYSARPGESEHQTGLCLDFTTVGMGGQLNEKFEKTEAFEWLRTNAHKYGFILRYPKDGKDITGYDYEPWHYRFVGRQAASEMYYMNLTLEEYLAQQ